MIKVTQKGDFRKTQKFLNAITKTRYKDILEHYGKKGVEALAAATPVDSGLTAKSWGYEIRTSPSTGYYSIIWTNSNVKKGWANIAILLQTGHGTRNGGYVQGRDYINPAIQPIFDEMAKKVWEEIERS